MRVQLWSYNYDPEPTGIGPVSRTLAEGLRDRNHRVEVVAAHPHYPIHQWGSRRTPYRENRGGISVLRLPLWVGRATAGQRYRQELTFMSAQFAALPALARPDVIVSASPSFPALFPALLNVKARRIPWVLWLQDILPDGATTTGIVKSGAVINLARRLERAAYREADRIVVLSESFTRNLGQKGVPGEKVEVIYNPATRIPASPGQGGSAIGPFRVMGMGNIGFSQGLEPLVEAFECSSTAADVGAHLIITGDGVAAQGVRSKVRSDRVHLPGIVDDRRLEGELRQASVGLVSQRYSGGEFNVPSKLMNFMVYGIPVMAVVNPSGEVARIVRDAGAGWVIDSSDPEAFPAKVAELATRPDEVAQRGAAAREYAAIHFSAAQFAAKFERTLVQTHESFHACDGRADWAGVGPKLAK